MDVLSDIIPGAVLNVPILKKSPWSFELEVKNTITLNDSDVFICKIHNIIADEILTNENISVEERMKYVSPVVTTHSTYFSLFGKTLGAWGEPKEILQL